jgi:hypothetical protein
MVVSGLQPDDQFQRNWLGESYGQPEQFLADFLKLLETESKRAYMMSTDLPADNTRLQ